MRKPPLKNKTHIMKRFLLNLLFSLIVIFSMPLFCLAGEIEDANSALVETLELSDRETLTSRPMSIAEIEKSEMLDISKCKNCPQMPFGVDNRDWLELKDEYTDGDVILYFYTNNNISKNAYRREGYALIRDNEVIDILFKRV